MTDNSANILTSQIMGLLTQAYSWNRDADGTPLILNEPALTALASCVVGMLAHSADPDGEIDKFAARLRQYMNAPKVVPGAELPIRSNVVDMIKRATDEVNKGKPKGET